MVKDPNESLRTFVNRFGGEALSIPNINMENAVEAFKMGLKTDSPFYKDLIMTPCRRTDEVRSTALRFIRLEEEKKIQKRSKPPSSYDHPNRKG